MLFRRPTPQQIERVKLKKEEDMPEEMDWINFVNTLAKDDPTKHEEVYLMNYVYSLNILAMWHYRDLRQKALQDEINRKNKS